MPLTPEEALRRHTEGDRSPEVMSTLNAQAFEAFHAPWEGAPREESAMNDDLKPAELRSELWKEDRHLIAPISMERLAHWAKETRGWNCYRMEDCSRILVRYRYSSKRDRAPDLFLGVEGRNHNIVKFSLRSNTRVEAQHFVKALRLANWWNQEYRWPKAMVRQDYRYDWDEDEKPGEEELLRFEETKSAELRLDEQLYLPEGIHQAGLEAWLTELLATSWEFWEVAHRDYGL